MPIYTITWLYIKQHNQTGLKYFGKTMNDPYLYKGSGKYWLRHLKKHGNDVSTTWAVPFEDKQELVDFALRFSEENNITESKEWANLRPENGTDGIPKGTPAHNKGIPRTQAVKDAVSKANKGRLAGDKNPSCRPEVREMRRKFTTEHNPSRGKSWIRLNNVEQLVARSDLDIWLAQGWVRGRVISQETRDKLSRSCQGRIPWNKGRKT